MSRLTDLLQQARGFDPKLAAELEREIRHSQNQRSFGLVFERHLPDAVELPTRPVRRGDTVYILPPRGSKQAGDKTLWTVAKIDREAEGGPSATVVETKPAECAVAQLRDGVLIEDLVVVAQHDDVIYPGLVQTGEVINSDDPKAPFHTVINSENLHALNLLTYTHRHKVDCIYIDPPYNTGAKDWKYNNDYVDGDDQYKHSKWLSMMEKRLELAKELLNPDDSVLIVTIDEKEYLRLGMLLEQMFPEARIQMVSSVISQKGVARSSSFYRTDEYIFVIQLGDSRVIPLALSDEWLLGKGKPTQAGKGIVWSQLRRSGTNSLRSERPKLFYPIFIDPTGPKIIGAGESPELSVSPYNLQAPDGTVAVWPIRDDGTETNWQQSQTSLMSLVEKGFVRVGKRKGDSYPISYLKRGSIAKLSDPESGLEIIGRDKSDGHVIVDSSEYQRYFVPGSHWNVSSHDATYHGAQFLSQILPGRRFPFPKSLYAVEDALRFFVKDKPGATVLDFFSGSGTTAHAVMRLNKQDGGRRRSISVTNNEVSFEEAKKLTKEGFRPGDPEWERLGICDYVTKPRIEAAITGKTPAGEPIKGDYKFTDEFPMADGFEANARFFTLTYEPPTMVRHGLAYKRVAPLLWLRAGQFGRVIESIPDHGWDVAESHGVLERTSAAEAFAEAVREAGTVTTVIVVADDDLTFQSAVEKLSDLDVEFVQLYSTYLNNFSFTQSGGAF
ncbi:site-specific DNA-methyltransferase [uncultured Corynebacterium sp.]|uniref:site-specific DNA-methyltransferase n=1 Tax=uncultured Corynebacterium sp. TaxID=159447 RepID=UPI00259B707F|nr:site-specific DNA-methyltransferase [uncultured Corynebacterium sp.]